MGFRPGLIVLSHSFYREPKNNSNIIVDYVWLQAIHSNFKMETKCKDYRFMLITHLKTNDYSLILRWQPQTVFRIKISMHLVWFTLMPLLVFGGQPARLWSEERWYSAEMFGVTKGPETGEARFLPIKERYMLSAGFQIEKLPGGSEGKERCCALSKLLLKMLSCGYFLALNSSWIKKCFPIWYNKKKTLLLLSSTTNNFLCPKSMLDYTKSVLKE